MSDPTIQELNQKIMILTHALENMNTRLQGLENPVKKNKHGLPIGVEIFGVTKDDLDVSLEVLPRGYKVTSIGPHKIVEGKSFSSLSKAAEFFSGIKRKSGWVYWKTKDGQTLKEAYKG